MQNTELQTINAQTDLVLTVDSEPLIHFDLLNTEYIILVENNPSTKNGKQLVAESHPRAPRSKEPLVEDAKRSVAAFRAPCEYSNHKGHKKLRPCRKTKDTQ